MFGFLWANAASSQPDNRNFWFQYTGTYWASPAWAAAVTLQYRTYEPLKNPRVGFVGAELQHHFKDAPVSLAGGYAHLFNRNFATAEETTHSQEKRLYQQIAVRQNFWKIGVMHRYQVEERWLETEYHTRLRYSIALRMPLRFHKLQENAPLYGILRNEIRVIVRDQPFDSNRIAAGLGYTFHKHLTLEGMWMSQLASAGNRQHFAMFVLRHDFGKMAED